MTMETLGGGTNQDYMENKILACGTNHGCKEITKI
jgi:hypothetical protein